VHLYTVSDLPETKRAVLRWDLFHVDGRKLLQGRKAVALRYGQSVRQKTLDLGKLMERHGRDNLHLRIALRIGRKVVSEETVLLTPPRFLNLRRGKTKAVIRQKSPTQAEVTFSSSVFQHRFAFDLPGVVHSSSDNYFELHPDQPKVVTLELAQPQTLQKLRQTLTHQSLVETY
jgi:beta-mannosidase